MIRVVTQHPLVRYFTALESTQIERTIECFSEDAIYLRPVTFDGMRMQVIRGHKELRAFLHRRGQQTDRHEIVTCVSEGNTTMVEGFVRESAIGGSVLFMSRATFDEHGLISQYTSVAFPADTTTIEDTYGR